MQVNINIQLGETGESPALQWAVTENVISPVVDPEAQDEARKRGERPPWDVIRRQYAASLEKGLEQLLTQLEVGKESILSQAADHLPNTGDQTAPGSDPRGN